MLFIRFFLQKMIMMHNLARNCKQAKYGLMFALDFYIYCTSIELKPKFKKAGS